MYRARSALRLSSSRMKGELYRGGGGCLCLLCYMVILKKRFCSHNTADRCSFGGEIYLLRRIIYHRIVLDLLKKRRIVFTVFSSILEFPS